MDFKILKNSKKSRARLGLLKTSHGVVKTPCLVPVATQAVVKTLTSQEAEQTKSQILICNAFHLHLKPGENIVKNGNGLHNFMNWQRPLMTDSGGFQVFSLGFGRDFSVGKIFHRGPSSTEFAGAGPREVSKNQQPQNIKITEKGVYFKSPADGSRLFLGPKESIKIQEKLGADIIFAFDECTSPLASKEYVERSLKRTHKWAEACLKAKSIQGGTKQALLGIIQGSHFKDLREQSSKFINSLGFDGFGIGGDLGKDKKTMHKILNWVIPNLQKSKIRHLLGIGYLEDMEKIVKAGIDTFDCTVPTHYARRGVAFTPEGRLDLSKTKFLKDKKSLDSKCNCFVCQNYKRNYISHLIKSKEITGMKLLTFHNLYFFNSFMENIRKRIKENKI